MWQFILLFIVLTPGILFTIPLYAKKGFGTKILTAILHGLVFVTAANFFMLEGMNGEGFQGNRSCGNWGTPSANRDIRIYTRYECETALDGIWNQSGECTKKEGGSYSYDCRYLNLPVANCASGTGGVEGERSTSCTVCPPGKYSVALGRNKPSYRVTNLCTTCQGNNITSVEGQSRCTPCGTNERSNNNRTQCFSCPSDHYFSMVEGGTCVKCTGNNVVNGSRSGCVACSSGKKPNDAGTACISIPKPSPPPPPSRPILQ